MTRQVRSNSKDVCTAIAQRRDKKKMQELHPGVKFVVFVFAQKRKKTREKLALKNGMNNVM